MSQEAFLGVESSFVGRRWVTRAYDERVALALSQRFALPDLLGRSLASRGVDLDDAALFLEPRLREALPDPSSFLDMDKAAARLVAAIEKKEKVVVFGDYDVDGGTSAALLLRLGRAIGADWGLYVPDRMREGYGPNESAMRQLAEQGASLVVCVDCGTTAHDPLRVADMAGVDVIVLDHHAAEPHLPPAVAVVNPNRLDEPLVGRYGALAAVGVTFLFVVAVNRLLRQAGFYNAARGGPDLIQWLDLVALGTVCDVVKLTGLNRVFVAQGLKVMEKSPKAGIKALLEAAGGKSRMDAFTAGFILGPRVNAGGRIGRSDLGARLLATDDLEAARGIAKELHDLNDERRLVEAAMLTDAEHMLHGLGASEAPPLIFCAAEGWHPGVIGIVAARLKEKYHRPALVISMQGDEGKGSGRSVGNIDLGAAVIAARQAGLLVNGGGHKMAAGLTVTRAQLEPLREFLTDRIGRQIEAEPLVPTLTVDGLIGAGNVEGGFLHKLAALAPHGAGNPEPRFALAQCRLINTRVVGEKHVSLIAMQGASRLRAIAFRAMDTELGPSLLSNEGRVCHLAGHIRPDDYRGGDAAQLVLDDAAVV